MTVSSSIKDWQYASNPIIIGTLMTLAIKIEQGTEFFPVSSLSKEIGLSVKQTRDILEKLEKTGVISKNTESYRTRITINKYVSPRIRSHVVQQEVKTPDIFQVAETTKAPTIPSVPVSEMERLRKKRTLTPDEERRYALGKGKEAYGEENVYLFDTEIRALEEKIGTKDASEAIRILSLYKKESGKTYKDDFAAINLWVIERLKEKQNQVSRNGNQEYTDSRSAAYADIFAFEAEIAGAGAPTRGLLGTK